jgi:cyclase
MRRAVLLGILIVAGALKIAAQQAAPPAQGAAGAQNQTLTTEKLRDNLFVIKGGGGNTAAFITSKGVVLVDTKNPDWGQRIMDQVRSVTDKPVTMIINTHTHGDHNGSNEFFPASVEIVAQENTKANMEKMDAFKGEKAQFLPDKTYEDKLTLDSGADQIDLYYFGAGHTNGDAFVVFPALRAMCVGDLMAWNMAPLIDPLTGGSVIALPDTLEKAVKAIKNVDLVIEGHGNVNTWQGFRAYAEFNRALLTTAKAALSGSQTPEQALAELEKNSTLAVFLKDELLKDLEYGGTPKSRALINLNVAFQELKGEPVTTNFGPARGAAPPAPAPAPATPPSGK